MSRRPGPGRPSQAVSAERRSKAIEALRRDPNIELDALATLLGTTRSGAFKLSARLVDEGEVPARDVREPAGRSKQWRIPQATVDRLQRITGTKSLLAAIEVACEQLEPQRRRVPRR